MARSPSVPSEKIDEICEFFGINKEEAYKCQSIAIIIEPGELITVKLNMPATFCDEEV